MSDMALLSPRKFTVTEYHRMCEVGVLRSGERVELLDGLVVEMSPIGRRHWQRHALVIAYLNGLLGKAALVVGQGSFPLGNDSEPAPDIAVLAPLAYDELDRSPSPHEVAAFIEFADSSLAKDTGVKLQLYGRSGVADYLVVDLEANVLLHFTEPHALGYRRSDRLAIGGEFRLAGLPGITLRSDPFLKAT